MKKNYRIILALVLTCAMMLSCFSGCASTAEEEKKATTTVELVEIADHLYEVTYTEDFDWGVEITPTEDATFACSGVQNGQYRGRNYDWYYADTDLCVVHTTVTEKREHASVGVADLSFIAEEDGSVDPARVPFVTVDGINDAGVCIQVNVMTAGEAGSTELKTETTDDDLNAAHVTRYVLDYADNVEEAIALLKAKDINSYFGGEELHWMISGPASETNDTTKTVVVEVFEDGLHVTENFVDDKPIMTNFNVSNFTGTASSVGLGLGYERWQILCEYYDQANSVMGTFDLMEKVYFSKLYDLYGDSFWYSEYNLSNLSNYYTEAELKGALGEKTYNYYIENYGAVYYNPALWDGATAIKGDIEKTGIIAPVVEKVTDNYNANELGDTLWITVHTAVYDLENLTLDLSVRESQDHLHFTIA